MFTHKQKYSEYLVVGRICIKKNLEDKAVSTDHTQL